MRTRTTIASRMLTIAIFSLAVTAPYAHATPDVTVPQTAQEHRDRAAEYQKKAADARQDVAAHRKMLADYSKTIAVNPKSPTENSYIKNMRQHCEKYIEADEAFAQEAGDMAKFHEMRARELEGK